MLERLRAVISRYPRLKEWLRPAYYGLMRQPMVCGTPITGSALAALLGTDSPTILEIGCNEGDTTRWFLETFAHPAVHCFEPDPRAAARFRRSLGGQPGIALIEAAIGAQEGTATFHMSGGTPQTGAPHEWDASGSIRRPKEHLVRHPWCTFETTLEVPVRTLDGWRREARVGDVDFIWMDVQGAELDVIAGGTETLARTRFLYTEYSNVELYEGQPSLRRLLRALQGFEVLARYPNDILLANTGMVAREVRARAHAALRAQAGAGGES